jgi:hypothetical protein
MTVPRSLGVSTASRRISMDRSCSLVTLVIPLASRLWVIWMIWQPPVRTTSPAWYLWTPHPRNNELTRGTRQF